MDCDTDYGHTNSLGPVVGAIVAASSNLSGIDLLRGRHLFEADSILVHLVLRIGGAGK